MTPERTLYLTWQEPHRRAILPVARLVHRGSPGTQAFEFRYIRGAREAAERGFRPFVAFPDLHRVYESGELFPFFANRVMPTTRPDYLDYIAALGLAPEEADSVAILSRNGGKRETDCIEIVPRPVPDEGGNYITHFLLRGLRYVPGAEERIGRLVAGERLFWMLDAQNSVNPRAIALRSGDMQLLGFVPDYLLVDVSRLIACAVPIDITVEKLNPPPAPRHHRLLCRVATPWPDRFVPFDHERFQPIEPDDGLPS